MVDAIAGTFGGNCEVLLHDLSMPEKSVIKIANGHVTGRDVGSPITDLVLSLLEENAVRDDLIGYTTRTKRGAQLRSTTVFIRNEKGRVIGCLCINVDISPYLSLRPGIDEMCLASAPLRAGGDKVSSEEFEPSVDSLLNELIQRSFKKAEKPVIHMTREDKLQMIQDLKKKAFF